MTDEAAIDKPRRTSGRPAHPVGHEEATTSLDPLAVGTSLPQPGSSPAGHPVSPPVNSELGAVLDSLGEVVFLTDAHGNWTYLNSAWTRITGFEVEATLGRPFLDYVHPDEREQTLALFMAVVSGGADRCHHTTRYVTSDGGFRWMHLRARVLRDAEGTVVGNSGTITDVTARRLAEETVSEHSQILELVGRGAEFDDLPVGTVVYGPELTVERASPLVQRLLGPPRRPVAPSTSSTASWPTEAAAACSMGRGAFSRPLGEPAGRSTARSR